LRRMDRRAAVPAAQGRRAKRGVLIVRSAEE
jgi:hypothetical protein